MTKGCTICEVCGREFPLVASDHYIARDPSIKGALIGLTGHDEPKIYDAFDCPYCGSQSAMQERKYAVATEIEFGEDHTLGETGCAICVHSDKDEREMPCKECSHNHVNHFTRKEGKNE